MKSLLRQGLLLIALGAMALPASAQNWRNTDDDAAMNRSMFRYMDEWPDPNVYRNAAGMPGPEYWQQQADYVIEVELDTAAQRVTGSERVTYHNNSPNTLRFLFLQLDQNVRSREHSRSYATQDALPENVSQQYLDFVGLDNFDGGDEISRVQLVGARGQLTDADYRVNGTLMKINLPAPLASGEEIQFEIDWAFNVPNDGRGAKEKVRDGWLYEIAQWFPRMSVYDDVNGWQTEQFLGQGEFYLNFGNYDVSITVPWNHIVDATGELQNPEDVLTRTQRDRLKQAYTSEEPVFIVAADEVMTPESRPKTSGTLTWRFKAENVRDFAWVSSKTYVWDAAGYTYPQEPGRTIHIHSLYPRDAMPLWDKVSTRATIQTMKTYGRMAFRYPYPKAANIHGPVFGMEYPMIAFCGARPAPDGTYNDALERALIGVTIHEVGHNWFPMIVASDERKWTWMDEGLNSFLEYYGQNDYARTYNGTYWTQTDDGTWPKNTQRGPAKNIVGYMRDPNQVPIMTESDLIHRQFGNNGYAKPAAGLVMLREHILGEEAFDEAFQYYAQGWMFKHPQPADFFRAMEEGAGENMAYFWRGWFFSTHANDQAIASVGSQRADSLIGNTERGQYYYRVEITNEGGLVLPVEMEVTYVDGQKERFSLPVDIWRNDENTFTKGFFAPRAVASIVLDPDEAYADVNPDNNLWVSPSLSTEETSALGIEIPFTLSDAQLAEFHGTYQLDGAPVAFDVSTNAGRLTLTVPGQGSFGLSAVSENTFSFDDAGITFTFTRDASGKVTGMKASGEQEFTAKKQ